MKVLVFHIGPDRYALRLRQIARVLPAAGLKHLPLAPPYVAGLLDLHGTPVPVIDLSQLAGVTVDGMCFDSRIVLVDYPLADGSTRPLGLLAEHVIGVETIDDAALADSGVDAAPFLGQVAGSTGGMLQLVELNELLARDVRELLFQAAQAAP